MLKKIIFINLVSFNFAIEDTIKANSDAITANVLSASIIEGPTHFGYSYSTGWSTGPFWIGIHCHNDDAIAGFQFELPDNLQLLDASGGRAEEIFSDIHHNKKGLILGFSMAAQKITTIQNSDNTLLLKIQVKATNGENLNFPIKSILAGSIGQKLAFNNIASELEIKSELGDSKLLTVSFYE